MAARKLVAEALFLINLSLEKGIYEAYIKLETKGLNQLEGLSSLIRV